MRSARKSLAHLAAALALGFVAEWAVCDSGASQPPAMSVAELTRAIESIRSATAVDEAGKAYAKGCGISRRNATLQRAYLRRLLQLGRPDLALAPAKELLELDPKAALAHGTIAYSQLRRSQYALAIRPAVRAAVLDPTNPSICHNAAHLAAWYEVGKRKGAEPALVQAMKDLPSDSRAFAAAYKKAMDGFKGLDAIAADKKKLAAEARKEIEAAEKEEASQKQKLQNAGKAYAQQRDQLANAQREWERANNDLRRASTYESRRSAESRVRSAEARARSIRREMAKQENAGRKIRKDLEAARKELKDKQAKAARIIAEADGLAKGMPPNFTWLPPAVDGVTTADATLAKTGPSTGSGENKLGKPPGGGSYLLGGDTSPSTGSGQAKAPPSSAIEQRLAEAEAAEKLELARLCLKSDTAAMKARARDLLKEVVNDYAATSSAVEARKLLGAMKE